MKIVMSDFFRRFSSSLVLVLLLLPFEMNGQTTAQDHFPSSTGYTWIFKNVFLDTLNNTVDTGITYTIDSFATTSTFKGKTAKVILGKSGPGQTLSFQPFIDTNYVNTNGNDGFVYFSVGALGQLAGGGGIDTLLGTGFIRLLKSFENWYAMYKFANTLNVDYQVFRYDTTITVDTLTLPLRFDVKERRLSDASLSTELGTFTCKRFLQTFAVSYLVALPPPLPALAIPILTRKDSTWIAPGRWIVQTVAPSTKVDLSIAGFPIFNLPGTKSTIVQQLPPQTSIRDEDKSKQSAIEIYPNPSSDQVYLSVTSGDVTTNCTAVIYSLTGETVGRITFPLVSGKNVIDLTGICKNKSAGIYIVVLSSGNRVVTKKFIKTKTL